MVYPSGWPRDPDFGNTEDGFWAPSFRRAPRLWGEASWRPASPFPRTRGWRATPTPCTGLSWEFSLKTLRCRPGGKRRPRSGLNLLWEADHDSFAGARGGLESGHARGDVGRRGPRQPLPPHRHRRILCEPHRRLLLGPGSVSPVLSPGGLDHRGVLGDRGLGSPPGPVAALESAVPQVRRRRV